MPASAGFWDDVMSEKYIENVSDLPYSPGTPDIQWQTQGHISAWVDIVGFRNLTKENGVYYIQGDSTKLAIVQYGYSHDIKQNVDSITSSLSYSQSGENLIASLTVVLKWHVWCRSKTSSWICGRPSETKTFNDLENIPERFTIPGNQSVTLKIYNGSVYKPQILNFNLSPGIISYKVNTSNGSITQYFKAGHVAYTVKNISYMNLTATDHYEQTGRDISKLNNEIVFTSNLTSIEFFTPYGKLNASANITQKQMPETNIKSGVFGLIYIVFVSFGGLYVMGRTLL